MSLTGFHWETKGHRFSLLTSDDSGHHPKMFIYGLSASVQGMWPCF